MNGCDWQVWTGYVKIVYIVSWITSELWTQAAALYRAVEILFDQNVKKHDALCEILM